MCSPYNRIHKCQSLDLCAESFSSSFFDCFSFECECKKKRTNQKLTKNTTEQKQFAKVNENYKFNIPFFVRLLLLFLLFISNQSIHETMILVKTITITVVNSCRKTIKFQNYKLMKTEKKKTTKTMKNKSEKVTWPWR